MRAFGLVLASLAGIASAAPAHAEFYRLDTARSRISFTYVENGTPQTGHFAALAGEARFDPADVGAADVTVRVEATGIDLGDPVRSHFAQSVDWFDAAAHPEVVFDLSALRELAPGRFRAEGVLRIKGREVAMTPDLTVTETASGLRATGELRLQRRDYGLGIGFSSLFSTVSEEVVVAFDLTGVPSP